MDQLQITYGTLPTSTLKDMREETRQNIRDDRREVRAINKEIRDNREVKMIHLFDGVWISRPAFWVLFFGLIFSIIIMFTAPKYSGIIAGPIVFLVVILLTYNINCFMVGHCQIWAWMLTVLYILFIILAVISMLFKSETVMDDIAKSISKSVTKSSLAKSMKATMSKKE